LRDESLEIEMRLYSLQMDYVLPNSRWSGAQAETIRHFETASFKVENIGFEPMTPTLPA